MSTRASVAGPDKILNINHSAGRLTDICRRWNDLQFLAHADVPTWKVLVSIEGTGVSESPNNVRV